MKRIAAAALMALAIASTQVQAQMAMLVRSELVKGAWLCTYRLGQYETTIRKTAQCPAFINI